MYFLTDPLAGLEELILMVILGSILLLFGIGYIVYKLLNHAKPDPSLQKEETEAEREKPIRSLTNAMIIVLLFFFLVAIGWVCITRS